TGEFLRLSSFHLDNGALVDLGHMEVEVMSALVVEFDRDRFCQAVLRAGHLNWVCKAFLGTTIPSYAWLETQQKAAAASRTAAAARARTARGRRRPPRGRRGFAPLAEAGLLAGRRYRRPLAMPREHPPWSSGMLPEIGQIEGVDLLKATFVAEYLIEEGRLGDL